MEKGCLARYPKKGLRIRSRIGFLDESGISERPTVQKSWAPKGKTPIILSRGRWRTRSVTGTIISTPLGKNPKLYFKIAQGTVCSHEFIKFLEHLRRHVRGKLILLLDRLAVHRSKESSKFLNSQRGWLSVEWLPAYAPELNPVEYLWSSGKRKELSNFCPDSLKQLDDRIRRGIKRIRRRPNLLAGFLKASGLFR